jgi:hypothetical protein
MPGLRWTARPSRPSEFLDVTSLTLDEFAQLVLPFEAAFPTPMTAWQFDGKPPDRAPVYLVPQVQGGVAVDGACIWVLAKHQCATAWRGGDTDRLLIKIHTREFAMVVNHQYLLKLIKQMLK